MGARGKVFVPGSSALPGCPGQSLRARVFALNTGARSKARSASATQVAPIILWCHLALAAWALPPAQAHDIPNQRVDRSIQVSLSPGLIAVDYEVSLSELTLTQDLRRLIGSLPGADRQEWLARYGQVTVP